MWSNLLSGVIGALVGSIGAVGAAAFTVNKEAKQGREAAANDHQNAVKRAEDQRAHDAAGRMAVHIVAVFDELRDLERRESEPSAGDFEPLRKQVDELRRSIVLEGPLVPTDLERELKDTRKALAEGIPPRAEPPTRQQVGVYREKVEAAGDSIQDYRRPSHGA
jgi:hypothetical protein